MSQVSALIKLCQHSSEDTRWIVHTLEKLLQAPLAYKTSQGTLYRGYPYKIEYAGRAKEPAVSARVFIKLKAIGNPDRTAVYEEHTDIVPLSAIRDAFPITIGHPSQFALEIGSKLIPIQLFHVHQDRGKTIALFVKGDSLTRVIQARRNQIVALQTYACSVDILHCIQGTDKKETEKKIIKLMADYRETRDKSSIRIPDFLKLKKLAISATTSHNEALKALSDSVKGRKELTRSLSQFIDTETELDIFRFMKGI
jgi:hypothetical protein